MKLRAKNIFLIGPLNIKEIKKANKLYVRKIFLRGLSVKNVQIR